MGRRHRSLDVLIYLRDVLKDYSIYLIAAALVGLSYLLRIPEKALAVGVSILLLGLLVYYRYRDHRRVKQRTYEAMSPELRHEIDVERHVNLEKRQKFIDAMERAGGQGGPPAS